jgi:tetratricopeptide (TPR) repeat protein
MGRIREALDDNERSLVLSRRSGSGYDTVAATAGIALALHYLGRYDEAITKAQEVQSLATRLGNVVYEFKGLELEGFAALAVGDLESVETTLAKVDRLPQTYDPVRTLPRIERLRAQWCVAGGKRTEAVEALRRAMDLLKDENDLEDLWGVEIELAFLNKADSGREVAIRALSAIAAKARDTKNIVVEVNAVAAIAEILAEGGKCDAELLGTMTLTLGRAEESGFVEQAARISVGLGGAMIDAGDTRAGQSRLVQAQRLLLQIASDLSPTSRQLFVRSPHIAPALKEIGRRLSASPT